MSRNATPLLVLGLAVLLPSAARADIAGPDPIPVRLSRAPVDVCRRRAAGKFCQSVRAYPPSLLSPKTFKLGLACVCLSAVPASRVRAGLRRLLRMQGGWSARRTPELRRIVDSIGIQGRKEAL